jgi:hypothetical protein
MHLECDARGNGETIAVNTTTPTMQAARAGFFSAGRLHRMAAASLCRTSPNLVEVELAVNIPPDYSTVASHLRRATQFDLPSQIPGETRVPSATPEQVRESCCVQPVRSVPLFRHQAVCGALSQVRLLRRIQQRLRNAFIGSYLLVIFHDREQR